ncbi:MAG: hypothetical protein UY35_C0007G0033 [Candidatus Saccharibacteria bacterium GW2011_GWC2_48_9]|nr:MAG: hypothetical protein UY35_C0007G0033 [Candidatus Saccharibacteria bacterium GW2011_GWC2_48_9]HCH34687.1 hypothetical protein [Candidatus Saccharibacteria bacterium]
MKLRKNAPYLYFIVALLVVVAIFFVLSPPRIGMHGDDKTGILPTEIRHLTLLGYFVGTSAAEDVPRVTIGTSPYTNYYARTYALEPLMLAAGLWAVGYIVQSSRTRNKRIL